MSVPANLYVFLAHELQRLGLTAASWARETKIKAKKEQLGHKSRTFSEYFSFRLSYLSSLSQARILYASIGLATGWHWVLDPERVFGAYSQ